MSYIESLNSGYLADVDTKKLYESYQILSGEDTKNFDKDAAIILLVREGSRVRAGDKLARVIYNFKNDNYPLALPGLNQALCVKEQKPHQEKVLVKVFV